MTRQSRRRRRRRREGRAVEAGAGAARCRRRRRRSGLLSRLLLPTLRLPLPRLFRLLVSRFMVGWGGRAEGPRADQDGIGALRAGWAALSCSPSWCRLLLGLLLGVVCMHRMCSARCPTPGCAHHRPPPLPHTTPRRRGRPSNQRRAAVPRARPLRGPLSAPASVRLALYGRSCAPLAF